MKGTPEWKAHIKKQAKKRKASNKRARMARRAQRRAS